MTIGEEDRAMREREGKNYNLLIDLNLQDKIKTRLKTCQR